MASALPGEPPDPGKPPDPPKPPSNGKLSRVKLDALLKGVAGEEAHPWWNDRLAFAHSNGLLTVEQLQAAQSVRTRVLKRYLWSITSDDIVRQRLRTYAIAASKLAHRLGAVLNMCAVAAGAGGAAPGAFGDIVNMLCAKTTTAMRTVMLPDGCKVEQPAFVTRVLEAYPQLSALMPTPEELGVLSSWNQAKKFILDKYLVSVAMHVRTHFLKRLKRHIRSVLVGNEDAKCEVFKYIWGSKTEVDNVNREVADRVIERLKHIGAWSSADNAPDTSTSDGSEKSALNPGLMQWHLELCLSDTSTCQPFPLANLVSRGYHRVDREVFRSMFKAEGLGLHTALRLSPALWNANLKSHHRVESKKGRRQSVITPLRKGEFVSSVETDGYGVSITIKTPHTERAGTKLTKEENGARHMERLCAVYKSRDDVQLTSSDPGRVCLATTARTTKTPAEADLPSPRMDAERRGKVARPAHGVYSRQAWKKDIKDRATKEWEATRRLRPTVKAAMDALSASGGKRNSSLERWQAYLNAAVEHWSTLCGEFLECDDRCAMKMSLFKLRRRALDRFASSVVAPTREDKCKGKGVRPLIVLYGSATMKCHGRGSNDTPVPVKGVYDAILRAFRRHRREGGVLKTWEHRTTLTCHRCGTVMEKLYETVADGSRREIHDYRLCTKCTCANGFEFDGCGGGACRTGGCGCQRVLLFRCAKKGGEGVKTSVPNFSRCAVSTQEERPKLRNRDFNAAINILRAGEAMLRGEGRPEHLRPATRKKIDDGSKKRVARKDPGAPAARRKKIARVEKPSAI